MSTAKLTMPAQVIYDKNSGRAACTLIANQATGSRFGHITILFLGGYWVTLTPRQRTTIFDKLSAYNGTKFTVTGVKRGNQSMHFMSAELLKIRQEMITFLIKDMGVAYPFDAARGAVHEFHSEMRENDATNANLVEGATFDFVASSGFTAKEINHG
jgi:hypothetical protein